MRMGVAYSFLFIFTHTHFHAPTQTYVLSVTHSLVWIAAWCIILEKKHYNDVMMSVMASQTTSLTIVYSTVYSRRRSKKTPKLRVTGLCAGNSPVTGEFPTRMASNAENVSIWWRHHEFSFTAPERHPCTACVIGPKSGSAPGKSNHTSNWD